MTDPVASRLRAAGCVYADAEARLLRSAAPDAEALEALVAARESGAPVEPLLGWAEVDGVRVPAAPGVFVPRRRSALLVRLLAEHLQGRPAPVVLDLCCGSAGLGLALAARVPEAELHVADLDVRAVACARRRLPADRVHHGDLFAPLPERLRGRLDAVLVNAPYVPSDAVALLPAEARDHEPRLALDGGPDGLDVHRRVAAEVARWLAPGGAVALETSGEQGAGSRDLLAAGGLVARLHHDPDLEATAVLATLEATPGDGHGDPQV